MFYIVHCKHQIGGIVKNLKESLWNQLTAMRHFKKKRKNARLKMVRTTDKISEIKSQKVSWDWKQQQSGYYLFGWPVCNTSIFAGLEENTPEICLPFYFYIRSSSTHTTWIIPVAHCCRVFDDCIFSMTIDCNRAQGDLGVSKIPFPSSNEPPCDL